MSRAEKVPKVKLFLALRYSDILLRIISWVFYHGAPSLSTKINTASIQGCPVRELRLVPIPFLVLGYKQWWGLGVGNMVATWKNTWKTRRSGSDQGCRYTTETAAS